MPNLIKILQRFEYIEDNVLFKENFDTLYVVKTFCLIFSCIICPRSLSNVFLITLHTAL